MMMTKLLVTKRLKGTLAIKYKGLTLASRM